MIRFYFLSFGFFFFSFSAICNDVITVTLISHGSLGKPIFRDWIVRDKDGGKTLRDGEALFIDAAPALIIKACPDECRYKILWIAGDALPDDQFELIVAKNGVVLPLESNNFITSHELQFSFNPDCPAASLYEESATDSISSEMIHLELERYGKGTFIDVIAPSGNVIYTEEALLPTIHLNCRLWPGGDNMIVCRRYNYNSIVAVVKR